MQGLNNYIASEVSKTYWLNKIYTSEVRTAHHNGDLHIHDLGLLSVYCVGWTCATCSERAHRGAWQGISEAPLCQIVNFFYTLQGEAAGAQAFSNFDTFLAPFIRHDQLSYREVKQALQEFVLISMFRPG